MKNTLLVLVSVTLLAMITPSRAQSYTDTGPPSGTVTTPGNNGGQWRNNNWRDGYSSDWRQNNWREDRTDDWRHNNWREDRTDNWRPREDRVIDNAKEKEKGNNVNDNDCRITRNRSNGNSNAPCW
jgi:hypothetical protein